jgi:hypothetical protein
MEEPWYKRNELNDSHDEVSSLSSLLSSKDSTIKDLCASKKFLSQVPDTAKQNIKILEGDCEALKVGYDKAMDKAVRAGRLLMKKPSVVVPDDIVIDVQVVLRTTAKAPASSGPKVNSTLRGAST